LFVLDKGENFEFILVSPAFEGRQREKRKEKDRESGKRREKQLSCNVFAGLADARSLRISFGRLLQLPFGVACIFSLAFLWRKMISCEAVIIFT